MDQLDGWNEWSKFVLSELKRMDKGINNLQLITEAQKMEVLKSISSMKSDIKLMKFQMYLTGCIASAIVSLAVALAVNA